jgi:hypothetical protein
MRYGIDLRRIGREQHQAEYDDHDQSDCDTQQRMSVR